MSEFTKGPWILDMEYLDIHSESGELIAEVHYADENSLAHKCVKTEEERANANLIAAAPELYEKLDELQRLLADEYLQTSLDIRKLLAKARGEL